MSFRKYAKYTEIGKSIRNKEKNTELLSSNWFLVRQWMLDSPFLVKKDLTNFALLTNVVNTMNTTCQQKWSYRENRNHKELKINEIFIMRKEGLENLALTIYTECTRSSGINVLFNEFEWVDGRKRTKRGGKK